MAMVIRFVSVRTATNITIIVRFVTKYHLYQNVTMENSNTLLMVLNLVHNIVLVLNMDSKLKKLVNRTNFVHVQLLRSILNLKINSFVLVL
jgi:hypothetical protein